MCRERLEERPRTPRFERDGNGAEMALLIIEVSIGWFERPGRYREDNGRHRPRSATFPEQNRSVVGTERGLFTVDENRRHRLKHDLQPVVL